MKPKDNYKGLERLHGESELSQDSLSKGVHLNDRQGELRRGQHNKDCPKGSKLNRKTVSA